MVIKYSGSHRPAREAACINAASGKSVEPIFDRLSAVGAATS